MPSAARSSCGARAPPPPSPWGMLPAPVIVETPVAAFCHRPLRVPVGRRPPAPAATHGPHTRARARHCRSRAAAARGGRPAQGPRTTKPQLRQWCLRAARAENCRRQRGLLQRSASPSGIHRGRLSRSHASHPLSSAPTSASACPATPPPTAGPAPLPSAARSSCGARAPPPPSDGGGGGCGGSCGGGCGGSCDGGGCSGGRR